MQETDRITIDNSLKLERLYQSIEYEVLILIAKYLNIDEIVDVAKWREMSLSNRFNLEKDILNILNYKSKEILKSSMDYIKKEVDTSSEEIDEDMKPLIDEMIRIYIDPEEAIDTVIKNSSKTMIEALNKVNAGILDGANRVYLDVIQNVTNEVIFAKVTLHEAVTKIIKKWAITGIPVLQRKDGAMLSVEGYLPMVIRSTQKNIANSIQEKRLNEYDIDLVLISSHLDSRPSHAPYQGKIFSRSGNDENYPSLSITGYGEVDGLITGINCRHKMYPYIEGLTNNSYETYDLEETNERYLQSQRQRLLERNIRKAKRVKKTLETIGSNEEDIKKADNLIKVRQFKMREFIKESGRTRRREREKVYD